MFIQATDAVSLFKSLDNNSVDLVLTDPPFYGIVDEAWDNQWNSPNEFADWLVSTLNLALPKLTRTGSLVFFGGLGKHKEHPLFRVITKLEDAGWYFRNFVTWKKRRAYGKSHDYLYCREEIVWFSRSSERTGVTFNIPLLEEKRGYDGFNKNYPAKSEFKRVSNVFTDIGELMRPERKCQKPLPLMSRLVATHSSPGQLVVDCFSGWGSTGVAALHLGRRFVGSEKIADDAAAANKRCMQAVNEFNQKKTVPYTNNLSIPIPDDAWSNDLFES